MRPSPSNNSLAPRRPAASPVTIPAARAEEVDATMKSIFAKANMQESSQHRTKLVLGAAFVIIVTFFLLPSVFGPSDILRDGLRHGALPNQCRVGIIADLDKRSRHKEKASWHSIYMTGTLRRRDETYNIEWDRPADVTTTHNEAGRGCELSELVLYQGKMLTFDDRTGIMFELVNFEDSSRAGDREPFIVPRNMFMEGDGVTDKGMKVEWATVKDGLLYVGSFGKEYTNNDGSIAHSNNLWTKVMTKEGIVNHVNWKEYYDRMRTVLGYEHPSYLLHEAVAWSSVHSKWYVLPRRMSRDPYDDVTDELKGANTIITASPDFSDIRAITVGKLTPERGFASFKFLPGSRDTILVALKSAEEAATDRQTTFMTIYQELADGRFRVLMDEVEIPGDAKFEGIEIFGCH